MWQRCRAMSLSERTLAQAHHDHQHVPRSAQTWLTAPQHHWAVHDRLMRIFYLWRCNHPRQPNQLACIGACCTGTVREPWVRTSWLALSQGPYFSAARCWRCGTSVGEAVAPADSAPTMALNSANMSLGACCDCRRRLCVVGLRDVGRALLSASFAGGIARGVPQRNRWCD